MKKQNFIRSSAVLIVSVMISKIAGAMFRIPLANLLGGTGMAYFSGAYGLFMPVYAVFVSGLSAAAAKVTAEKKVFYGSRGAEKVKKYSLILFSLTGIAGTAVMVVLSGPFSVYAAGSDRIWLSLIVIAPSVLFSCITAAYRGCAEGHCTMYPTAVSQIIESAAKLILGIALCQAVINNSSWFRGRFTCICTDVPALASAGACAGVMLSVFAGMLYMIFDDIFRKSEQEEGSAECHDSGRDIMKSLIKTAVPVAAGSLLSSLTSLIDLCTIIRYTERAVNNAPAFFTEKYSYVFDAGINNDGFAEFAYGSFAGMAVTVFNLVPSFTNMFGRSIFPLAAEAWTRGDTDEVRKNAVKVMKITAAAAVPAGLGIFVLSDEILSFLFPLSAAETMFCADALRYLGISVIFLCIAFPVFSMLQATGKAGTAAGIMMCGAAVKFAGNILLVRIPEMNVSGAAVSTGLCYAVILIMALREFYKHTGVKLCLFRIFYAPVYSAVLCTATVWIVKTFPFMPDDRIFSLFIPVLCGGAVYTAAMFLLGEYKFFLNRAEERKT